MERREERNRWAAGCFVLASGFLFFFNLWGRSLENRDYLRYAEAAREMIHSGDWATPRLNGEIYIHKPPLFIWMIALPSSLYGIVTPFLTRLPSALFAWIGGIVVYIWGRRLWGSERAGFISAGALVSSYLYFWQGRIARVDMVFSVLILFSLYFFYAGFNQKGSRLSAILFFIGIGLAGLTKGPIGILIPLWVVFLFLLKEKQWKKLVQKEFLLGYLIVGVMTGVWLFLFLYRVGWGAALQIWQETDILTRSAPFYLYGYRIFVDFAPWSILLPFLIYHFWRNEEKRREEWFLWIWFAGIFLLLTVFPVRASRYLLPVFPALALLIGGFWGRRSFALFGAVFLVTVLTWHTYEWVSVNRNGVRTCGPYLVQEVAPFRGRPIYGYRMDVDVLAKINFHGDVTIPHTDKPGEIKGKLEERKEIVVMTTEEAFSELKKDLALELIKRIACGKARVLLIRKGA